MPRFAANLSMLYNELDFPTALPLPPAIWFHGGGIPVSLRRAPGATERAAAPATGCGRCCSTRRRATGTRVTRGWPASRGARRIRAGWRAPLLCKGAGLHPRIHVMAGLMPAGVDAATLRATGVANLRGAAEQAAATASTS